MARAQINQYKYDPSGRFENGKHRFILKRLAGETLSTVPTMEEIESFTNNQVPISYNAEPLQIFTHNIETAAEEERIFNLNYEFLESLEGEELRAFLQRGAFAINANGDLITRDERGLILLPSNFIASDTLREMAQLDLDTQSKKALVLSYAKERYQSRANNNIKDIRYNLQHDLGLNPQEIDVTNRRAFRRLARRVNNRLTELRLDGNVGNLPLRRIPKQIKDFSLKRVDDIFHSIENGNPRSIAIELTSANGSAAFNRQNTGAVVGHLICLNFDRETNTLTVINNSTNDTRENFIDNYPSIPEYCKRHQINFAFAHGPVSEGSKCAWSSYMAEYLLNHYPNLSVRALNRVNISSLIELVESKIAQDLVHYGAHKRLYDERQAGQSFDEDDINGILPIGCIEGQAFTQIIEKFITADRIEVVRPLQNNRAPVNHQPAPIDLNVSRAAYGNVVSKILDDRELNDNQREQAMSALENLYEEDREYAIELLGKFEDAGTISEKREVYAEIKFSLGLHSR